MFGGLMRNRLTQIRHTVYLRRNYYHSTRVLPSLIVNHNRSALDFDISTKTKLRNYCAQPFGELDPIKFEDVCKETLESLCEYFEEIVESNPHFKNSDVVYGDGVLTVIFGDPYGTYVINRQTPNKQIWLSSPTSGPKRYDYVDKDKGYWIYKHTGESLHQLLQQEINKIVKNPVDFSNCSYSLI